MNKKKKSTSKRKSASSNSKKKTAPAASADPEMDVLQERFSAGTVDFGSLMNLVK
jgi:hypothetical protein